jgi:YD repeat-containing protein
VLFWSDALKLVHSGSGFLPMTSRTLPVSLAGARSTSVSFQYDTANRRTQLTFPNGIVAAYTYDQDSHVTGITWTLGSTQVGNLTYGYDAAGRVTSKDGSFDQINLPQPVSGNAFNADNAMTRFGSSALSYDSCRFPMVPQPSLPGPRRRAHGRERGEAWQTRNADQRISSDPVDS